jgi:tyrosine-protein kinase Etk/Wzc
MENDQHRLMPSDSSDAENNLIAVIHRYAAYWRWFALSVIAGVLGAFLYLRYQTPLYEVDATILIKDDKKGGSLSELSAFEDLGLLKNTNNIENEIEVLKSRALMTLVVKELRLNVRYI